MDYIDICQLREAYKRGENIIKNIKKNSRSNINPIEAIEISYDLQFGSYIDLFKSHEAFHQKAADEKAKIITEAFPSAKSILDVGCGELTNTSLLFKKLTQISDFFCFDISWSRAFVGRKFYKENTSSNLFSKTNVFCANMDKIPLPDNSIDIIISTHAIEPNHGREKEILNELLRVSKMGLVLFEPSFELGSDSQKSRMIEHGYVRGLPDIIKKMPATLLYNELVKSSKNMQNQTAAFVISKHPEEKTNKPFFADPISKEKLIKIENGAYYYSPSRGVVYPTIMSIPVLNPASQVLTSALMDEPLWD
ncbi:MAG: class I SAM-dependent methyltransferase [Coxiellaceae bacterium]|nr:class I SAM-dependent methyltransferase [Coxiellaceae bacterium]